MDLRVNPAGKKQGLAMVFRFRGLWGRPLPKAGNAPVIDRDPAIAQYSRAGHDRPGQDKFMHFHAPVRCCQTRTGGWTGRILRFRR